MTEKKPLVILTGPTAVGKTALSIKLASEIGGEIISADSMQVYRQMDIGSAKIKPEEMGGIPHHLIDILEPEEEFNVCLFEKLALEAMEQIYERGHIPVVVGGTGFYIQALLYQIDFTEEETTRILDLAERISLYPDAYCHVADNKKLATLFYEPSTRTRLSFESAMLSLGGLLGSQVLSSQVSPRAKQ